MRVAQIILSLALLAAPAFAEEAPSAPANAPAAANASNSATAGRITFVSGNVAIYQLGQPDWTRAAANLPISSGDWLATDGKARAELAVGANAVEIASDTELNVAALGSRSVDIALSKGRLDIHLRQFAKGASDEIDLPGGAVWLTAAGTYDIAVGTNGQPTRIAVFEGSAKFVGGGLNQTVEAGNALVLQHAGANLTASVERASPDEFVKWADSRDRDQRQIASRSEPQPAAGEVSGTTEPEAAAEPERRAERHERHARIEPHRRFVHRHFARRFHRRYYRYGYAMRSPVISPFSLLHSLVPFLP